MLWPKASRLDLDFGLCAWAKLFKKKKKVGENNGQLCFVRHHGWRTHAACRLQTAHIVILITHYAVYKHYIYRLPEKEEKDIQQAEPPS